MRLNAQELRTVDENLVKEQIAHLKRHPLYLILENVYDTYNVGGLFRLSDALGVSKMYLCGEMEIPPNPKIKKASIGTYKIVPWEYKRSAGEAIAELRETCNAKRVTQSAKRIALKSQDETLHATRCALQVVAVEQDARSVPYTQIDYSFPVALIVGNETSGVTKETLDLCDHIAEIPMWGINKSLNVIVSAAIVSYHVMGKMKQ